jgi:predicted GNAT family N-acyltransferase
MILSNNYLEKLQENQMYNLAEFVVQENFKHHSESNLPGNYKKDVSDICKEELDYYKNAKAFVSRDECGAILGTIRVLQWNFTDVLPLQKIFGINPLLVIKNPNVNNIYHIGRFAIKKGVRDISLLKKLMVNAIAPICEHKDNIAFAECDSKLLRILNILGIKTDIIGESIEYLGSETIPIAMSYDGLIDFYVKNLHLAGILDSDVIDPYMLPTRKIETIQPYKYTA